MLQKMLEKKLEKKAGRNYGPPGNKTLIYFIDDMNMPEVSCNKWGSDQEIFIYLSFMSYFHWQVDCYGTVQPHTLIRQHLDYGHWYDRSKLTLKEIQNCQYVSCMNPTAGSFTINPRLLRHFCVFAVRSAQNFLDWHTKLFTRYIFDSVIFAFFSSYVAFLGLNPYLWYTIQYWVSISQIQTIEFHLLLVVSPNVWLLLRLRCTIKCPLSSCQQLPNSITCLIWGIYQIYFKYVSVL